MKGFKITTLNFNLQLTITFITCALLVCCELTSSLNNSNKDLLVASEPMRDDFQREVTSSTTFLPAPEKSEAEQQQLQARKDIQMINEPGASLALASSSRKNKPEQRFGAGDEDNKAEVIDISGRLNRFVGETGRKVEESGRRFLFEGHQVGVAGRRSPKLEKAKLFEKNGNGNNNENLLTQSDYNRLMEEEERKRLQIISSQRQRRRKKRFLLQDSDRLQVKEGNNSDKGNSMTATSTFAREKALQSRLKCRVEENLYLDFEEYKHYTCSNCYKYMPKSLFSGKLLVRKNSRRQVWLYDEQLKRNILPNETEHIRPTFKDEQAFKKWNECCRHAIDCCIENAAYLPNNISLETGELMDEKGRGKCHATWDGLSCWPETQAGLIAQHDCPNHVYFFDFTPTCNGRVTKQCFSNESWYIRADHEWSDYSNCAVLTLYATRLLIGSVWHVISAFIIGPALIVLDRLPNRGGSKRVRILSNLLFWLLVNGLLAATQKMAIIGGVFHKANPDEPLPQPPLQMSRFTSTPPSVVNSFVNNSNQSMEYLTRQTRNLRFSNNEHSTISENQLETWHRKLEIANEKFGADSSRRQDCDDDYANFCNTTHKKSTNSNQIYNTDDDDDDNSNYSTSTYDDDDDEAHFGRNKREKFKDVVVDADVNPKEAAFNYDKQNILRLSDSNQSLPYNNQISSALVRSKRRLQTLPPSRRQVTQHQTFVKSNSESSDNLGPTSLTETENVRCKRSTSTQTGSSNSKKQQSVPVVLICWIFSLGIRITRQLGYAWMFTGAVYLCSVLHFAPAEPPGLFIKWLMILTNGFPVVIALVYIIARTIYDRSPLTLLVQVPYYYFLGDLEYVDYLWSTQLDCWLSESKYSFIEEIADFPNLVLIILNGALFVVTLIIMCRINRPGSTRPEMSLGDYFKAAGTLVLLYGAHYMLIAYRVQVEGCIKDQVIYYSFLFVDGIQGIAVSYVFCYRTPEGREIISKWWRSCLDRRPNWLCCKRRQNREQGFLNPHKRFNQSTRSNNSACNGKDAATTELISIKDTPLANHNF